MRRLQAIPMERPRILIIMYARCLLKDLKLCFKRLLNMLIRYNWFRTHIKYVEFLSNTDYTVQVMKKTIL